MQLAKRVQHIAPTGIREVLERANALEKAGRDIVHLEIGRPDFDTPAHIKAAAQKALDEGKVHYTSVPGIEELRAVLAQRLHERHGLAYDPDGEIAVTVGANEAVFITMLAMLDPGDEVLIPDPCWMHYFSAAEMAGGKTVSVPLTAETGFLPRGSDIRARITDRTRLLVLNTPHNPTGMVYPRETLEEVAQIAREHDLWVLSDEIYEDLIYDGACHISLATLDGMRARTVIVNGFSKNYAMTGWRLGYIAADRAAMAGLVPLHQYATVCATSFAQWGGLAALTGPQDDRRAMVAAFDERRRFLLDALPAIPGLSLPTPRGAFYVWVDVTGTGRTCEEVARHLLEEAGVATVPGSAFGEFGDGYIRISYANSLERLREAVARMQKAL